MPYIFDHLDLFEKLLKRSPFGLITDIDGTISPTAPTPQQAEVTPLCRHYLSIFCKRLALVVGISGRPAKEVKEMVRIDGMVYIGNHGMERWTGNHSEFLKDAQDYPTVIKTVVEELAPLLSIKGLSIENKGVTATVHYRLCADTELARRESLAAIQNSPHAKSLRIMQESKYAINLLPPVKVDKGAAVLNLIQEYKLQGGVYLGDDTTDIDGFRAIRTTYQDQGFQGLAIAVSNEEVPQEVLAEADFTLNGVSGVERLLEWMTQNAP